MLKENVLSSTSRVMKSRGYKVATPVCNNYTLFMYKGLNLANRKSWGYLVGSWREATVYVIAILINIREFNNNVEIMHSSLVWQTSAL